jgi:histidine triad (HIT) family protein
VPRSHIPTLNDATDAAELGHLLLAASQIARAEGIAESGYRTVLNSGADGGQSVFHVHAHILGGRALSWPPG